MRHAPEPIPTFENLPRALELFERTIHGASLAEAGKAVGISKPRAGQIVRGVARMLLRRRYLDGVQVPNHRYASFYERRKHAAFWLAHVQRVRAFLNEASVKGSQPQKVRPRAGYRQARAGAHPSVTLSGASHGRG